VTDERLERWLDALLAAPGLTAITDRAEARRVHVDGSLVALPLVRELGGPVVDVGSGGGAPGIPIAAALPEVEVTLLEASRRKCDLLEALASEFPNVRVVWGRAEEQPRERWRVALAKALAAPPVAAELCLPLVRQGGAAILYVGPTAPREAVARVAERLNAASEEAGGLLVLRKVGPTPRGFPRRPGMAKKRPLA
jgi:16S rRNA (guanine527-N7)-methyltransferase